MNQSKTPRTDALKMEWCADPSATGYYEALEFLSSNLETELAAAKKDLALAHEALDERDKLRAELAASKAREDTLAEALKQCRPAPCDCREHSDLEGWGCEHLNDCSMRMSNENAMQALKEWGASK